MEYQELISVLKEPAIKVMNEMKVPASILIGLSILILDNDDYSKLQKKLIDGNNPFAIRAYDKSGTKVKGKRIFDDKTKNCYHVYDSMEAGISSFVSSNPKIFENMKNVTDYMKSIIRTDGLDEDQKEELQLFIEEYKLNEFDLLDDEIQSLPIIEVDPSKSKTSLDNVAEVISDINGDIKKKEEPEIIKLGKPSKIIKKSEDHKIRKDACKAGTKIHVLNTNLYKTIYDKVPTRAITGLYYLYSGVEKYQRYAIVVNKDFVGQGDWAIIGYIDNDEFDIIEE